MSDPVRNHHLHIIRYALILTVAWTAIVGGAFAWSVIQAKDVAQNAAYIQAGMVLDRDILYRRWNAGRGGIYIQVSDQIPPNPYLANVSERDITTPSGRLLTLVNPAYMTRQVNETLESPHGEESHITSLNPLRPQNAADPWETEALTAIEQGAQEQSVMVDDGEHIHYRLMRPLITEESCLKCHAVQGYKVGDIRGGISVTVPAEELLQHTDESIKKAGMTYSLIWLTGIGGIVFGTVRLRRSDLERGAAEKKTLQRNRDLSALHEIAAAISSEIDLLKLLEHAIDTVTGLAIFQIENRGGIFILEGDRLRLMVSKGHDGEFQAMHEDLRVGECLCGLAAQNGEIIISRDSTDDIRHTIFYPEMKPHGHVVVPCKVGDRVLGVLYLYTPPEVEISKDELQLLESIGNQLGTAIEKSELYEEARALSLHDPLTGLANRNMMNIELDKCFAMAKRYSTPFSLVMIDLDYFKRFNDTHGHLAGDALLVGFSGIIDAEVRETDVAVRYGGEEFLLILNDTGLERALEVAERIRIKTERKDFAEAGEPPLNMTISLGVASFDESVANVDELISRVDSALYKAKETGRNRVEIWKS